MPRTPDQERRRKLLIQHFDKDWEIRESTLEISRKNKPRFIKIIDFLYRRQRVHTLYLWASEKFTQQRMMSFPFPMTHDNIPKPPNMFSYFSLKNGWTIPIRDLKYLYDGPLFSEEGETLVKPGGYPKYYWNKVWPWVLVLVAILEIVNFIRGC